MVNEKDETISPQAARSAGLSLIVLSLANYLTPGEERTKLLAWLKVEAKAYESHGIPRDVLRYFQGMIESIELGEPAELLKSAHRSDKGLH